MFSKSKTRTEQLASLAFHWKMEFQESDESKLLPMLKHFKLFSKGGSRKLENIMCEMDEWIEETMYIFDYKYTVSTGKSSHTSKQTVFFVSSKHLGIPAFRMHPENILHKIGSLLGMQDIDFESYPIFSKQYLLQADEEDIVRSFFGENLLHFFSDKKSWNVEAVGYYFILYFQDKQLPPSELGTLRQTGMSLLKMFKDNTFNIELVTDPDQ